MSEMALELIRKAKAEGWKRLDLGNTGIVGEVPAEIWELTELEELILSEEWDEWVENMRIRKKSSNKGSRNKIFSFSYPPLSFAQTVRGAGCIFKVSKRGLAKLETLILAHSVLHDLRPISWLINLEVLSLYHTNISKLHPISSLSRIKILDLSSNPIYDIKPLSRLENLRIIDLSDTYLNEINPLRALKKLRWAGLDRTNIKSVDAFSNHLDLEVISMSNTQVEDINSLSRLENLTYLNISRTRIKRIGALKNLFRLEFLYLTRTIIEDIEALEDLVELRELDLAATPITNISPISRLFKLEFLNLAATQIRDIQPLQHLLNLVSLLLSETKVDDLSPLANLIKLDTLLLHLTAIQNIQPLKTLSKLRFLRLWNTNVSDVGALAQIPTLAILDISKTKVADIQALKGFLEKGVELTISDTPLTNPPYEVAIKGNQAILNFWREVEEENTIPATEIKLFLLGNTTVGKSTLAHILAEGEYPAKEIRSTFGAKIDEQWTLGDKQIHIWDFGGQEYFHATHQMLLNGNAIYIVMVDPAHNQDAFLETEVWHFGDPEPRVEQLEHFHYRYWLEQIQAHDPHAHVFLLWNKIKDATQCSHLRIKDEDVALFSRKGAIACFPCELQLAFQAKDKFWIRKWEDIHEALDRAIQKKLKEAIVLSYWPTLRDIFAERSRAQLWIPYEEFVQLCQAPGRDRDINNIIVYLRDMTGRILYFDRPELAGKVFLNPQHINTLIYAILSRQVIDQQGGFSLKHAQSQVEKAFKKIKSLKNYQVESKAELATDLLLIMQEFGLIFETEKGSGRYVAPQYLLHSEPPQLQRERKIAKLNPKLFIQFSSYIPRHIITRFISKNGIFAKDELYWKFGVLYFIDEKSNMALVHVDYKTRIIAVEVGEYQDSAIILREILAQLRGLIGKDDLFTVSEDGQIYYPIKDPVLRTPESLLYIFGLEGVSRESAAETSELLLKKMDKKLDVIVGQNAQTQQMIKDQSQQLLNRILSQNSQFRDQLMSLLHRLDDKADQQLQALADHQALLSAMDQAIVQGLPALAADLQDEINALKPPANAGLLDRFKINLVKLVAVGGAVGVFGPAGVAIAPFLDAFGLEVTGAELKGLAEKLMMKLKG